ncbi:MAG: hypothetical protein R3E68_11705 [Burkholderiaceae bacterium]
MSDRELARLTAEKIDQIESEMISDALADGVSELEAKARNHPFATASKKPDAVALLKGVAMKEARREFGVEDDSIEGMDVVELDDSELPGLDFTPGIAKTPQDAAAEPPAAEPAAAPRAAKAAHHISFGQTETLTSVPGETLSRDTTLSGQDPLAIDVIDGAMPDVLEAAAILFSNGNFDAAHEACAGRWKAMPSRGHRMLAWHMQFDLLRVKGDREASIAPRSAMPMKPRARPRPGATISRRRSAHPPPVQPVQCRAVRQPSGDAASQVDQLLRAAVHQRECGSTSPRSRDRRRRRRADAAPDRRILQVGSSVGHGGARSPVGGRHPANRGGRDTDPESTGSWR